MIVTGLAAEATSPRMVRFNGYDIDMSGRRNRSRLIWCAFLAVLLACVTAWLMALTVEPYATGVWEHRQTTSFDEEWWKKRDPATGPMSSIREWQVNAGADLTLMQSHSFMNQPRRIVRIVRVGFPFRAFTGEEWTSLRDISDPLPRSKSEPDWLVRVDYGSETRYLPYRPTIGLALNAILWFVVLAGGSYLWRLIRTRTRIARGQCAKCGHEIICPECGNRWDDPN